MYDDIYFFKKINILLSPPLSLVWRRIRDSHQDMMTERGNFYNHMQLHNLFCYNNIMFTRRMDPMNIEMQIWTFLCHHAPFFFWGDIFWSFMELNKPFFYKRSHWVQLIFIRLLLFRTNCSWNEIKWTAFWGFFQVLMKFQFKVN